MPELAEVERGRRLLENAILNKTIVAVSTQEDARVFVGDSAAVLEKALPGRTVLAVKRRGKNIYLRLDGAGPTLAFHLGMTGSVAIKGGEFHYRRAKYIKRMGTEWPPFRWKILLTMADETEVCSIDTSRFGRIRAVDAEDAISIPPLSLLARDAWLDLPSPDDLQEDLACRTAPIKTVLLDQNAAVSGLGNYNVDEILFQSRIHPRQPSYTLSAGQIHTLHAAIKLVAAKVMEVDADTTKLPKTWLYKHRYGRKGGIGQTFVMEDGAATQVLGDYSNIPLPKRRKKTAVEPEDGDESPLSDVDDDVPAALKTSSSRKRKRAKTEEVDVAALREGIEDAPALKKKTRPRGKAVSGSRAQSHSCARPLEPPHHSSHNIEPGSVLMRSPADLKIESSPTRRSSARLRNKLDHR